VKKMKYILLSHPLNSMPACFAFMLDCATNILGMPHVAQLIVILHFSSSIIHFPLKDFQQ
jgi:hypothetical protein